MSKKKHKPTDPILNPPKPKESQCFRCDGSGVLCNHCGETEDCCGCAEENEEDDPGGGFSPGECPDCKGSGK